MGKLIQILFFMAVTFTAYNSGAADCRKIEEKCVEGPSSKVIGGQSHYRECWNYRSTYECIQVGDVNYCAALEATPGCNLTSSICTEGGFNGKCLEYTNTYRCGNAVTPSAGVIELPKTYTIVYDEVDTSSCQSLASNPSCKLSKKECIEGPSSKNINGLDVYKECWQWREDYNCIVNTPHDYCAPLKAAGCVKDKEVCTNYAFTGECIEKKFEYVCDDEILPPPENVEHIDTNYNIVSEQENSEACRRFDENPNCDLQGTTCEEGPETRKINGLDVYKECWKWKKDYICATEELSSTCQDLQNNPLCAEIDSVCVDTLPNGACGLRERQFKCSVSEAITSTEADCGAQSFCMDGNCFDTGHPADRDFGKAIAMMEISREAGVTDIFKGESNKCSRRLFGLKNCCKSSSGGASARDDNVAAQFGAAGLRAGAEVIKVYGSPYVFSALTNSGVSMLESYAAQATLDSAFGGAMTITGNFSIWGAEFAFSAEAGFSFVGFDPWSLAISIALKVVMDMMQCDEEDQATAIRKGQGLCHKVGSYCSKKVLKACVTKKESYCCFPSRLGKIINQQGRPQIGKSWGPVKNPDCSGFTVEELERLRFDEMDLSEFINTIPMPNAKSANFAVERLNEKARSYYTP